MFIYQRPYLHLVNKVDGKTYYVIGEQIMNLRMVGIPIADCKCHAADSCLEGSSGVDDPTGEDESCDLQEGRGGIFS